MTNTPYVYATVTDKLGKPVRIAALADGRGSVGVHISHGGMLGFYDLDRFEGGKLTARTLRLLFNPETV